MNVRTIPFPLEDICFFLLTITHNMKKLHKTLILFCNKLFTATNLSKILVIFTVGILSRYLINEYLNINVFTEYLSLVSITFYSIFATFVVFVNESFSFFNINIIPNFILSIFNKIGDTLNGIFIKNTHPMSIGDSRKSGLRVSDYGDNISHYPSGTQVSRYPTETQVSQYPANTQLPLEPLNYSESRYPQGEYNTNSFYARMAKNNPYQSGSLTNDLSGGQDSPNSYIEGQFDRRLGSDQYDFRRGLPNNSSNDSTQDSQRYFVIDSLESEGGGNLRLMRTIEDLVTGHITRSPVFPDTPRPTNLTTPDTMTPLFPSEAGSINPSLLSIDTNNTNHGTVGRNSLDINTNGLDPHSRMSDIDWRAQRNQLTHNIRENLAQGFADVAAQPIKIKHSEVTLYNNKLQGKAKVGVRINKGTNTIHSLYIKYHDLTKRKFFWNIWEKGRGNYDSYQEFKDNFDPKIKIFREISKVVKSDLSKEVRDLLNTNPFGSGTRPIEARDITRLPNSSTQSRLNNINSSRHRATALPRRERR